MRRLDASATFWPQIGSLVHSLPLFGEDGDLLLLARDGRIHQLLHDDPSPDCIVADSLAHLPEHRTLNVATMRSVRFCSGILVR